MYTGSCRISLLNCSLSTSSMSLKKGFGKTCQRRPVMDASALCQWSRQEPCNNYCSRSQGAQTAPFWGPSTRNCERGTCAAVFCCMLSPKKLCSRPFILCGLGTKKNLEKKGAIDPKTKQYLSKMASYTGHSLFQFLDGVVGFLQCLQDCGAQFPWLGLPTDKDNLTWGIHRQGSVPSEDLKPCLAYLIRPRRRRQRARTRSPRAGQSPLRIPERTALYSGEPFKLPSFKQE